VADPVDCSVGRQIGFLCFVHLDWLGMLIVPSTSLLHFQGGVEFVEVDRTPVSSTGNHLLLLTSRVVGGRYFRRDSWKDL